MKILDALKSGQTTSDARKTKVRAITAMLAAPSALTLYAVSKAFWPEFPLDVEEVGIVCAWIMFGIGSISHIISTKTLGVEKSDFPDFPQPSEQQRRQNDDRTYG